MIDLIYAAPNESAALYLDDLRALARERPNLHVHTMFEDTDGLPTVERIESSVGALEGKEVMLAGPPAMVRALTQQLRARGVPAAHIHSEEGLSR
jgi:ferredoxin-NADP reductase